MKHKIYKYELEITDRQNISIGGSMPTVLTVHEQDGKLMMWVQQEDDFPGSFNIDVDVISTGNPYETSGKYVGTAFMSNGAVWHVFAETHYIRADL
jgi:hypothetical protein